MNRNIVISILSIIASLSLMSGATYAYFSSTATNTDNTFSSGTLVLALTDTNDTEPGNIQATFGATGMGPGDCSGDQVLTLENNGTVAGHHVEIAASNSDAVLASTLRIQKLQFDSINLLTGLGASAGDPTIKDLADLAASGYDDIPMTDFSDHTITMDVCLDSSATDAVQGLSNTLNLTFTLNQHGSL